mmetsp:Transcript_134786/g.262490  ORF Transcript_134786/g.262490 Transcript_134786/m.262490 type:complete len:99 (+) Transcript_134786:62-358(+)
MSASAVMKVLMVFLLLGQAASAFEKCKTQTGFDIAVCKSHMCTDCTLEWCCEACQKRQKTNPDCRCEDWPEARKSYSAEGFSCKGRFGDKGDYAKEDA